MALEGEVVVWITSGGSGRGKWKTGDPVEFREYAYNSGQKRWKIKRKELTIFRYWAKFILVHGYLPVTVDHINGYSWDDRCSNLRAATYQQQAYNRPSLGIRFRKRCTKRPWEALIQHPQHGPKTIGYYPSKEAAIAAYHETAKRIFGEYHRSA